MTNRHDDAVGIVLRRAAILAVSPQAMKHAVALMRALLLPLLLSVTGLAVAQGVYSPETDPDVVAMRRILGAPELDLARAKVEVDRAIDPSIDGDGVLAKLDAMAKQVRDSLPENAPHNAIFEALRGYLYRPGPWNAGQPFQYDFADPYGRNIRNKLLATYLRTKKGNCVSMPLLFLVLAQKLGLRVTAATAPEHVFVMYRDDEGVLHNFEATSGGFKLDASYRHDMPMSQRALDSGIYMRWLDNKEVAVLISSTLLEHYASQGQDLRRIVMANILLQHSPRSVEVLLQKASAYHEMATRLYTSNYRSPAEMTAVARQHHDELEAQAAMWRGRAEMLGWQWPNDTSEAQYRNVVNRAKATQQ